MFHKIFAKLKYIVVWVIGLKDAVLPKADYQPLHCLKDFTGEHCWPIKYTSFSYEQENIVLQWAFKLNSVPLTKATGI